MESSKSLGPRSGGAVQGRSAFRFVCNSACIWIDPVDHIYFRWRRTPDARTVLTFSACRNFVWKHANPQKYNNTPPKTTAGRYTEQYPVVLMLQNSEGFYNQKNRCSSARLGKLLEPTTPSAGKYSKCKPSTESSSHLGVTLDSFLWYSAEQSWLSGGANVPTPLPQNGRTAGLTFICDQLGSGLWTQGLGG